MGRKLNLSHLSEGECRQILDVIQRDYSIRQKEKARLTELQKLVKDEEQKRLVMSRQKQFNGKYCICCFSSFGLIFNKRTKCKSCGFFVCRDCSVKVEGEKDMICLGCSQQRELQVQVCEWFYGQIRNRFRRFGSAKVVRSLYKRDSQSSDSVDHSSSADSGVYHQLSPPAKEMLSGEVTKAFLETLEKQTSTVTKDLLGVPYKALLENPDWFPMLKPEMMSVAVQAPDDVLSEVLDSRQALEDFVFNLPPEEEELVRAVEAQIEALQRSREAAIDGQFNTVSVAMCDLSSPEMVSPYAFRYGSSVQIQIPRERVDTPVDFVMEVPLSTHEYNNNKEWSSEVVSKEVELEMGVTREEGGQEMTAVNGGQTAPFGVDRCAVSMELRPIQAVIVRYLQEGDDTSLWPDFRFHRNKPRLHAREKRPKLDADVSHSHHGSEPEKGTERHISTLKLALGYPDHRATNPCPDKPAVSTLDEKPKGSVSVRVNEIEQLLQL